MSPTPLPEATSVADLPPGADDRPAPAPDPVDDATSAWWVESVTEPSVAGRPVETPTPPADDTPAVRP